MTGDLLRRFPFTYQWPSLPDLFEDFPPTYGCRPAST